MDDEAERRARDIQFGAHITALGILVTELIAASYERLSDDQIEFLHHVQMEKLRSQVLFQTDDWALSDVGSDAICEHVQRLLEAGRARAARLKKPKL